MIEYILRKETQVIENQFSFMYERSTKEANYLLRCMTENHQMDQQDYHFMFNDLDKTYDRVPKYILWKYLVNKMVRIFYI